MALPLNDRTAFDITTPMARQERAGKPYLELLPTLSSSTPRTGSTW